MSLPETPQNAQWPDLPFNEWKETLYTVQLWTQIVGKIRLRYMPWINHSWHVTLYVSPRGLTTGSIPYKDSIFEIEFDFIDHVLIITASTGAREEIQLYPRSVADFYSELLNRLQKTGVDISIHAVPNEVDPAIPFEKDETHKSYEPEKIKKFWQALVRIEMVFTRFRATFKGKCSPVHFFWGAFDLAVTRFSGRVAPEHTGNALNMPVRVMQEAYSHEVSSVGFWPGGEAFPEAAFYSYCYPSPDDYGSQHIEPAEAFYSKEMGEFFLPYEVVRTSVNPQETLMKFCVSTYEAAATTGKWDRDALECDFSSFEKK